MFVPALASVWHGGAVCALFVLSVFRSVSLSGCEGTSLDHVRTDIFSVRRRGEASLGFRIGLRAEREKRRERERDKERAVSYTHLTLPTKRIVYISVVAV